MSRRSLLLILLLPLALVAWWLWRGAAPPAQSGVGHDAAKSAATPGPTTATPPNPPAAAPAPALGSLAAPVPTTQSPVAPGSVADAASARPSSIGTAPRVTLAAPGSATAGGIVEVRVDVDLPTPARAVIASVRFDPAILQLAEASEGELVTRPGSERALETRQAAGQVDLTARVTQGSPLEGGGTLAVLAFNVLQSGSLTLGASIVATAKGP